MFKKMNFRKSREGRTFLLLLFALLLGSASAHGQTSSAPLSLSDAVAKALESNPQTKTGDAGEKLADAVFREAKGARYPVLQFTQSGTRSNNPVFVFGSLLEQGRFTSANFALGALNNPSPLNNFRTAFGAQVPIFDQRQTSSRIAKASLAKEQSRIQSEGIRQRLRFEVVRAYYGVTLAREQVKVAEKAVASAEANRNRAKDLTDVGMTTESDLLAAEVELASAQQQLIEAQSGLVVAKARLNLLIGGGVTEEHNYTDEMRERFFAAASGDALVASALAERPDMQIAEIELRKSSEQLKGAEGQWLPRVDAFGNYGYSSHNLSDGSSDYTLGVSVSFNIFDAGRRARIDQARAARSMSESGKQTLELQVRLEVLRAEQDLGTAQAKIKVLIKSVARADEALRIVKERYRFGLTQFTEVLRAEAANVRAAQGLLSARYDYYVAYASLLLATGQLKDVRGFE